MWDERGYVGEPFARPAETCAQEGASQPNLQCLKVAKEKRILREGYEFRGQKQTRKIGVRCRRQGGGQDEEGETNRRENRGWKVPFVVLSDAPKLFAPRKVADRSACGNGRSKLGKEKL